MEPNQMNNEENTPMMPIPQKRTKDALSIPLAIVLSGVLIASAILFTEQRSPILAQADQIPARERIGADNNDAPIELLKLKPDDHILGNPNADVIIIEYTDTQCPFCQSFHETMLQVMNSYGKTGQVAWTYRHFPLAGHPYAKKGGEALECTAELGGNQAFWKLVDKIFSPTTKGTSEPELIELAVAVGVDREKFVACLNSGKWAERVERDFEEGVNVGVKGTPHTVIWNKKTEKQIAMSGAYPFESVKTVLGLVTASAQNSN